MFCVNRAYRIPRMNRRKLPKLPKLLLDKCVRYLYPNIMETKEVLRGLGLQTYEADVYEALLRLRLARVKDLTRVVTVPRVQIYAALQALMDKGMCVETRGKFTSYSPAAPLVAFKTILKNQEDDL